MAEHDSTEISFPKNRPTFKNIAGLRTGKITVLSYAGRFPCGHSAWNCACDCGKLVTIRTEPLTSGRTQSCGCTRIEKLVSRRTHGLSKSRTYRIWKAMKTRCCNPNTNDWNDYGGRGIAVCERWTNSFENFLADMGECPTTKHSIDRINNEGNYCPENCRWATTKEQTRNARSNHILNFNGKSMCIAEWAEHTGISDSKIRCRIRHGWTVERMLTTP